MVGGAGEAAEIVVVGGAGRGEGVGCCSVEVVVPREGGRDFADYCCSLVALVRLRTLLVPVPGLVGSEAAHLAPVQPVAAPAHAAALHLDTHRPALPSTHLCSK